MADLTKRKSSRGEMKVEDILSHLNLPYEIEYEYDNLISTSGRPLRFDFAILDDDGDVEALIEVQGEQHYEATERFGGRKVLQRQKFNDSKKRAFCRYQNIQLIELPYWELESLTPDILMEKIYG